MPRVRKLPRPFGALLLLALVAICTLSIPTRSQTVRLDVDSKSSRRSYNRGGDSLPIAISFKEFFDPTASDLEPSAKLLAASGKRVRLTGFMAQMENSPLGAFYLCPSPVFCDEAGAGTADLPPERVLVLVASAAGKKISFIRGPLDLTGILELARREEPDGSVSFIRLILDKPASTPITRSTVSKRKARR